MAEHSERCDGDQGSTASAVDLADRFCSGAGGGWMWWCTSVGSWLVAAVIILAVAGCGGHSATTKPDQATSAVPTVSPSAAAAAHAPSGAVAGSNSACALLTAGDAAAALGMAVGKARPAPGVDLSNGAVGSTCEWVDSAGGTAGVASVRYPSPAIASKEFKSSTGGVAPGSQPVHLPPGLAPFEGGDTGSYNGTRIAESFLLDGDRELDVTINEPTAGPGSRFSLAAFVTLVQQAAQAWR